MSKTKKPEFDLTQLLSVDKRPSNRIKKVDSDGNFDFFEGVTIVMPLKTNLSPMYEELKKIVPVSSRALLPKESYHVTLISVACRSHFSSCEEYNQFIRNSIPQFKKVKQCLKQQKIRFVMKNPSINNKMHFAIHLEPADDLSKKYLEETAKSCIDILGQEYRQSNCHLSLAYKYPGSDELSKNQLNQISQVIEKHTKGVILEFGRPELCRFSNMCKFIPV
jgi:hypothetical protein